MRQASKVVAQRDGWLVQQPLTSMNEPSPEDVHLETERRAYLLWQQAGCPEGRETEFWTQAEEEVRAACTTDKAVWERIPKPFSNT